MPAKLSRSLGGRNRSYKPNLAEVWVVESAAKRLRRRNSLFIERKNYVLLNFGVGIYNNKTRVRTLMVLADNNLRGAYEMRWCGNGMSMVIMIKDYVHNHNGYL